MNLTPKQTSLFDSLSVFNFASQCIFNIHSYTVRRAIVATTSNDYQHGTVTAMAYPFQPEPDEVSPVPFGDEPDEAEDRPLVAGGPHAKEHCIDYRTIVCGLLSLPATK